MIDVSMETGMRKRYRIAFAGLVVAVAGLLVVQALRPRHREPGFQGRTVRDWAMELAMYAYGDTHKSANAIRCTGTNAIPTLLEMLQRKDPPVLPRVRAVLLRYARSYCPKSQALLYRLTDRFRPCAAGERRAAVYAFRALGADAGQASSALRDLYARNRASSIEWEIGLALMAVDPDAAAKLGVK
jgi:hypothetical protein